MRRIRVLLVDDQKLFVESLFYVMQSRAEDIEVVGIAHNGKISLEMAKHHQPDIILMDVRMPVMDGVEATKAIHELHPGIKILMLSTFQDDDYVRQALRYGAVGYLIKDIAPEEVITAIRAVMMGTLQIAPAAAKALIGREFDDAADRERNFAIAFLTKREKEVLSLITSGHDNSEIANFLEVQEQTARNYVHNLYSKLGVSSRLQLMRLVNDTKLLEK